MGAVAISHGHPPPSSAHPPTCPPWLNHDRQLSAALPVCRHRGDGRAGLRAAAQDPPQAPSGFGECRHLAPAPGRVLRGAQRLLGLVLPVAGHLDDLQVHAAAGSMGQGRWRLYGCRMAGGRPRRHLDKLQRWRGMEGERRSAADSRMDAFAHVLVGCKAQEGRSAPGQDDQGRQGRLQRGGIEAAEMLMGEQSGERDDG